MDWQPIETAPKDGTVVLGCCYLDYLNEWIIVCVKFFKGQFVASWNNSDDADPTHWQPLPKPPTEGAA